LDRREKWSKRMYLLWSKIRGSANELDFMFMRKSWDCAVYAERDTREYISEMRMVL
jgi:hypothetical protein